MKKKVLCIVLARLNSQRLKRKVIKKFEKKDSTIFENFIKRIQHAKEIDKVVLATTIREEDKVLVKIAKKYKLDYFCGSEKNVLDRFYKVVKKYETEYEFIVRANVDCPFFMPTVLDNMIKKFKVVKKDFYSPFDKNIYPFGFTFCLFNKKCIFKIKKYAKLKKHKEHIENFCIDNPILFKRFYPKIKRFIAPEINITLDTYNDFINLKKINHYLKNTRIASQPQKLINYYKNNL